MLLALDIGNTNVKFGVFDEDTADAAYYVPRATWRDATEPSRQRLNPDRPWVASTIMRTWPSAR